MAVFVASFGAGIAVLATAVFLDGIEIYGSACGGAGSSQRCLRLERTLSVAGDLDWVSVLVVGCGVGFVALALIALVLPRRRLAAVVALAGLAAGGLAGTEYVDARLCPYGDRAATCGRAEEWMPVLGEHMLRFRAEERRRVVGRPVVPGGPSAEAEQTLDSFGARPHAGWRAPRGLILFVWFLALAYLAARLVRPVWLAPLAAATLGGSVWAAIVDRAGHCPEDGGGCWHGVLTALALVASAAAWLVVWAVARVVTIRRVRQRDARGS